MKAAVADAHLVVNLDDGVLGVELSVRLFVRLLNALDALNDILCVDVLDIYRMGVADKTENR